MDLEEFPPGNPHREEGGRMRKGLFPPRAAYLAATLCLTLAVAAFGQEALWNELNQAAIKLYQQRKYDEAVAYAERALNVATHTFGDEHPNVARSLNNLATVYQSLGKYALAQPPYERALEIYEKSLGKNHYQVAISLDNLAELHRSQGKYADVERLYKRSFAIYEMVLGKNHPDVAQSLTNLADLYRHQREYSKAEPLYIRALQMQEAALGNEDPTVARTLTNLAELYTAQGRYSESEPLYQKALEITERAFGRNHPRAATSLNNLAGLYRAQGKYSASEPLYQRALEIHENALGRNHPRVASILHNLADVYAAQGRYAQAEPLFWRALEIKEKALGRNHFRVATSLNGLAELYKSQGNYAKAEPLYRRALEIVERGRGEKSPQAATILGNLASLCQAQGRYSEAEQLCKRSLAIHEQALGRAHPDVAISLNNLAAVYSVQGKYVEAEQLFTRSLKIYEQTLGGAHPYVATALNGLAGLYDAQGKYSEAERLHKTALEIGEKALGPDHPDVVGSVNNLAMFYKSQGKYREAEPLYKRALETRRKALGNHHPSVADSLNNLALLLAAQGRYSESERFLKRALGIMEKTLGNKHRHMAIALNNLAGLYRAQGRYSAAEPLQERSLAIMENALGRDHPDVAKLLANLGDFYQQRGNLLKAELPYRRARAILEEKGLPADWVIDLLCELYLDRGESEKAEKTITETGHPRTKARLCLIKRDYQRAMNIYETGRIWAEVNRDVDDLFAAYTGLGMASEGLEAYSQAVTWYRKAIGLTEELRSSLPREVREEFFDVRVGGFYRTAPYEGLALVLFRMNKPLEALSSSEYTKARVFAEAMSRRQEALGPDIPLEVLARDERLTDQLAALRKMKQEAHEKRERALISSIDTQMKHLHKQLQDHIRMLRDKYPLFAATKYPEPRDLSQTALNDDEWTLSYDVTDSGVIIYLTKGKELLRWHFKPIAREDVDELIRKFRNPMEVSAENVRKKLESFDFGTGGKLSELLVADILPHLPEGTPLIVIPDDSLGLLPFEMLVLSDSGKISTDKQFPEATGAEFFGDRNPISYYQSITALTLARTFGKGTKTAPKTMVMADPVFRPEDARLANVNQQRRVVLMKSMPDTLMSIKNEMSLTFLRLPLTGELAKSLKELEPGTTDLFVGMEASKQVLFKKPLNTYGSMVFATHGYFGKDLPGVQEPVLVLTLPDQPKGQDGFLRMSEVMGLKLNADVVALTACQTGLGKRLTGEGTMGMGRAFQYAGARAVLMSLWSVAEHSSVMLVESFFKHLKEGKSKLEALQLARKEIREAGYDHPFFWAGFTLAGEMN